MCTHSLKLFVPNKTRSRVHIRLKIIKNKVIEKGSSINTATLNEQSFLDEGCFLHTVSLIKPKRC